MAGREPYHNGTKDKERKGKQPKGGEHASSQEDNHSKENNHQEAGGKENHDRQEDHGGEETFGQEGNDSEKDHCQKACGKEDSRKEARCKEDDSEENNCKEGDDSKEAAVKGESGTVRKDLAVQSGQACGEGKIQGRNTGCTERGHQERSKEVRIGQISGNPRLTDEPSIIYRRYQRAASAALFLRRKGGEMAATRLIALHINKGKTLAKCLSERLDYSQNPDKTDGGELISSYECDPVTADEEFLLSKRKYDQMVGRIWRNDVIAYQIRQSFKPGEITAEEANNIGYETAMRFTKGRHAFTVSTHTDRAHIHNHIIFNSTNLDGTGKFRNFLRSGLALQKLSDIICLEHGLSVIQPKPYWERARRTVYPRRHTKRGVIEAVLEDILKQNPKDLKDVARMFRERGYEVKEGRYLSVRGRGQKRFIRLRSLHAGYTEQDIQERIGKQKPFELLIDIQSKLQSGKGRGYERWAKTFNVKQMAQVLCFLQENGIRDYEELAAKAEQVTDDFDRLSASIKEKESRLQEIATLKKHIFNYSRTRSTYEAYRKSGYSKKFMEEHREEITLHKAAKAAFDELSVKKLPKIKELNAEYAAILSEKKALYGDYRKARKAMQEYTIARKNVETILEIHPERNEQTTTVQR